MKTKCITPVLACVIVMLSSCASGESQGPRPPGLGGTRSTGSTMRVRPMRAPRSPVEAANSRALRAALIVAPSFRERLRVAQREPYLITYRFSMVRGQTLDIRVTPLDGAAPLGAEMFHEIGPDLFRPARASGDPGQALTFTAPVNGEYVLRLQPAAGAGGLYDVVVSADHALAYPLAGGFGNILGVFGEPRDNGARMHEGIDIGAPRGTPVVAVAAGRVSTARNTPTGGLVVWLEDERTQLSYYYAHLDELLVREGTFVQPGHILGTVGNTGNARATPPHLHFAIYRPGKVPINPAGLLAGNTGATYAEAYSGALGEWAYVSVTGVRLRSSPTMAGIAIREISPSTPLRVLGHTDGWHRVVLPDGTTGFVAARLTSVASIGTR